MQFFTTVAILATSGSLRRPRAEVWPAVRAMSASECDVDSMSIADDDSSLDIDLEPAAAPRRPARARRRAIQRAGKNGSRVCFVVCGKQRGWWWDRAHEREPPGDGEYAYAVGVGRWELRSKHESALHEDDGRPLLRKISRGADAFIQYRMLALATLFEPVHVGGALAAEQLVRERLGALPASEYSCGRVDAMPVAPVNGLSEIIAAWRRGGAWERTLRVTFDHAHAYAVSQGVSVWKSHPSPGA